MEMQKEINKKQKTPFRAFFVLFLFIFVFFLFFGNNNNNNNNNMILYDIILQIYKRVAQLSYTLYEFTNK